MSTQSESWCKVRLYQQFTLAPLQGLHPADTLHRAHRRRQHRRQFRVAQLYLCRVLQQRRRRGRETLSVGSGRYCSPRHRLPSGNEDSFALDEVAGCEPGRYCSPRHRVPFSSSNEGPERVSMIWRPRSARRYLRERGSGGLAAHEQALEQLGEQGGLHGGGCWGRHVRVHQDVKAQVESESKT